MVLDTRVLDTLVSSTKVVSGFSIAIYIWKSAPLRRRFPVPLLAGVRRGDDLVDADDVLAGLVEADAGVIQAADLYRALYTIETEPHKLQFPVPALRSNPDSTARSSDRRPSSYRFG